MNDSNSDKEKAAPAALPKDGEKGQTKEVAAKDAGGGKPAKLGRTRSSKTGRKTSVTGGLNITEVGQVIKRRLSSFGLGNVTIEFQTNPDEIERLNENRGNKEVLKELGGIDAMLEKLCVTGEAGIPHEVVNTKARQNRFGANVYKEAPPKSLWSLVAEQFEDQVLQLLMFAALISTVLGVAVEEQRHEGAYVDGIAIWCAVVLVSMVGAINNYQKEKQFRNINQQRDAIDVTVLRSGKEMTVPSYQVVVGDMMLVDTGDKLVADGLLVLGNDLIIDESSLTGESEPMMKDRGKDPFVWTGTQVSEGSGKFVVTAVGERSEWGKTMAMIVGDSEETPLQEKLGELAILIGKIGTVVAAACFIVLVASHFAKNSGFGLKDVNEILEFFIFAITIIVVAVPEGLPLAVTISLAYSMMKMMKDNNFVRVLEACETMGGATAICSDKTGTLTENRMTVIKGWFSGKFFDSVPEGDVLDPALKEVLAGGISINSKAHLLLKEDQETIQFIGNRTECALLMMIKKWGIEYKPIRKTADVVKLFQFTSERKMSSVVVKKPEGQLVLYSKGAAEILLRKSTSSLGEGNQIVPLDDAGRKKFEELIDSLASNGLRTLCLCYRNVDSSEDLELVERDLTLAGIVGIKDPLRKETSDAVAQCKNAGITVRMVTGDNLKTAKHIGEECGIFFGDGICLEGQDFRSMSEEELIPMLPKLQVLARSSPSDKLILVRLLKKQGEVVAVTGDGTNDAPALKESNVGLSMGKTGTEVAKEASDIVILDDNFSSIVKSVLWGRSIFRNIRKFLQFQVTINLVALALSFVAVVSQKGMPLTVLQLLWVNLIMDSMAALALATEQPTPDLLDDKPHGREEPLVSNTMIKHITVQGAFQLVVLLFILFALQEMHDVAPQYELPIKCTRPMQEVLTPQAFDIYTNQCVGFEDWTAQCTNLNTNYKLSIISPCKIEEPKKREDCSLACPEYAVAKNIYDYQKDEYDDKHEKAERQLYSFLFNTFIFMQVFNEVNARKIANEYNVFDGFFDSPIFACVLVFTIVIQAIIMETAVADFFKLQSLSWEEWVGSVGIGLATLPISFATKVVLRQLEGKKKTTKVQPV